MTERWEADGYDALRVVVDQLKADNAVLKAENARLQAQLDGWNYTDAKELRAENARLKGLCLSAIDALESEGFYHTGQTFRDELEAEGAETA